MFIAKLYLHVVVFWFLPCSQVVLAGGKYVLWRNLGCECKGHFLFPGKSTDFAFWVKLCPGWRTIMTDELRGEKLFEGSYCWPR